MVSAGSAVNVQGFEAPTVPAVGGLGGQDVLNDSSLLSGQFLKAVFILLSFTEYTGFNTQLQHT